MPGGSQPIHRSMYHYTMRLNAVGITCSDLERSLAFYGTLGLSFPEYDPDIGHYEASLGDGVRLMLDSEAVMASFIDGFTAPTGNDRMSLAVECEVSADVDATYRLLIREGSSGIKEPFDAFWGQRYATVTDPDGNHVDLYAALAT